MSMRFLAVSEEKDPMYDAAIISEDGTEYWHNPECNFANNSHSVTKFFISSAIGILVREGKLSLKNKVTDFFTKEETGDKIDNGWKKVTVEHALQHKTGMLHIPYGVDEDEHIALIGQDFLKNVFSVKRKAAAAWHGYSQNDGNLRNDRLLEAFLNYLDEKFGELKEN